MKSRFSILCLLVNILLISCEQAPQYYEVSGRLHTPYHIKFEHTKPLDKEIDEQLKYFYHLFNAFDSTSVISQVNQTLAYRLTITDEQGGGSNTVRNWPISHHPSLTSN